MGGGAFFVADAYMPDGTQPLDAKPYVLPVINQALSLDDALTEMPVALAAGGTR